MKKKIILYIMGYIWYQNFEFYSRNHFFKYFEKWKKSLIISQYKKTTYSM
jgi:hypothetical protein